MIIDAHATDTVPSHEVRQRALEALANAGEPMSEVTYDALRKRLAESLDLEKSHEALRLGVEAQANLIEAQAARIAELEAEVEMWRDENFKKKTAYQQRGVRIAELEVALRAVNWRLLQTYEFGKCRSECLRIIDDALEGGEDE